MQAWQREFIDFTLQNEILRFGEFTLKSGRVSPYFFNAGLFNSGASLARLGRFYAKALIDASVPFDMLFGPAYKGIPLASATAIALAEQHERDCPYAFNRKEAKDHGEGGMLVGAPLQGRVMIVDDVITDGAAKREAINIIRAAGAEPVGIVIAIDRQERGESELSAAQALAQEENLHIISPLTFTDLITYLQTHESYAAQLEAMQDYHRRYAAV